MIPSAPTNFKAETFILDNPNRIHASAIRYTPRSQEQGYAQIILLFAHALGFHKEHWEPVIQELFQEDHATGGVIIKEAWAVDCPDHGRSAILNEAELQNGKRFITCYEYGDVFLNLIRSGRLDGGCKLVFIGHSAGAVSGILTTQSGVNPYSSMILVEPAIISRDLLATNLGIQKAVTQLIKSSGSRRDLWSSVSDAKSWLLQRSPWRSWDPRILSVYTEFGMRPLPTRIYPNIEKGVTLSFPKLTHGLAYGNLEDQYDALDRLKVLCDKQYAMWVIFGRRIDFNPQAVQEEIATIVGRNPSGKVVYIQDAGHMIIQEKPSEVAKALCGILHRDYGNLLGKL